MNQTIYDFLCNYLTDMNISFCVAEGGVTTMSDIDAGLRKTILKENQIATVSSLEEFHTESLYHFSDFYNCSYSFFQMPDGHFFFIGPYLFNDMHEADIQQLLEISNMPESLFSQLQDYYYSLPLIIDKTAFYTIIRNAYRDICGVANIIENVFDLRTLESREEYLRSHSFIMPKDPILSMNLLEKRYQAEDAIVEAVTQGNSVKAMSIISHMSSIRLTARSDDELRHHKVLTLALNTLLRRTAYTAGVHPFYIDSISANYSRFIENAASTVEIEDLIPYLVRSYCELVEKRSTSLYSSPVRHILVTIDASMNSDLSLKRFANELFLNTSYLSSLFKKETGMTLTDYVNHQRITYAKRLLKSTTLSIQAVASAVGISDIHYFTRLFRRETNLSPREFRKL